MFILVFSIAIYRACYITYHYRIIKLSTFTIDRIELKQVRISRAACPSSDFQIELSANFSKSYCPLNLEFIGITASMFTEDLDLCSKHNSGSLVTLSVDKLRLDKKTPLKFSANLKVCKFRLESTLLELLGSNFAIQISFYVRARFCYVPLYFFKNIVKKKSDLVKKSGSPMDSDLLAFRVNSSPQSNIQVGLRRRFFTETLGEDSGFVFNVGCLKFDFSGCIHKSILVSSFDTRYYWDKSAQNEGSQKARTEYGKLVEMSNLYVPGVCVDDHGDDVVFFFITIPLYDGESLGKMVIEQLKNRIAYLKIDKVSILDLKNTSGESSDCPLNDILIKALSGIGGAQDQTLMRVVDNKLLFTEIRVFRDMYILNFQKNTSLDVSSMFVNSFKFSNKQISCNIGLSTKHSLYGAIKNALESSDLKHLYEHFNVELRCVVGDRPVAFVSIGFVNAPADEEFTNVVELVMTFQDELDLKREDLKNILFQFTSFSLNGKNVIILNLFEIMVDYSKGIFLKQDDRLIPVHMFPPAGSRVFRLDHELSDSSNGKFLNIRTRFDISTYGAREKVMSDTKNLTDNGQTASGPPVGSSFVKIEVPSLHVSATNSFMKLRSKFLTSSVFFIPRYDTKSKSLTHVEKRGTVEIQSAIMFKKLVLSDRPIDDLMLQENVCIKINQLMVFRILPSSLVSTKGPKTKSLNFVKFLPHIIEFDVIDEKFTSFMSSVVRFRHILKTEDHLSDYLKCVSSDFPSRHGWNPEFCSIFRVNEPTEHFIKNVFHARRVSHAIRHACYVPLVLDATDFKLAFVYTGDNLFIYFPHPFSTNIRLADPSIYDDPDTFTSEFIRESRLHRLVDFIIDVVTRKIGHKMPKATYKPSPEIVSFSLEMDRTEDNFYRLSSKVILPKQVLSCPKFIYLNMLGKFSLCSELADAFVLNLSLDLDGNNFVIQLDSSWGNGFGCEPIELIPRIFGKELNHLNLNIFELVDSIRKYINFFVENLGARQKDVIFDYLSPESMHAFFDSGHDQDFIFEDDMAIKLPETRDSRPRFSAPWECDVEFTDILKKSFGFGLEFKLWSERFFLHVGNVFSHVFNYLPCRVKPDFVDISINLKNLLEFRIENDSRHKVFGLERLDITQTVPIRIPILSNTSQPRLGNEENELFYAGLRNKTRTSMDQYVNINMEFYFRSHSTLVSDALYGNLKVFHSLYRCNFSKLYCFGGCGDENGKPPVKFRLADLRNSFIDLKLPFSLNLLGEPIFLILRNNTSLTFISKLKGPLLDPKVAISGYNISLPISSRRLSHFPKGPKKAEHQARIKKLREKTRIAKPDRRHMPKYFKKQYEFITRHGDSVLHSRGITPSGITLKYVKSIIMEWLLNVSVPGEGKSLLNNFYSWVMSLLVFRESRQNPYIDYDRTVDKSFAENELKLSDEDTRVLQDLLYALDFSP